MATRGFINKISCMVESTVAADKTFTFANSAAQYTTIPVEFAFTSNQSFKRLDHLITIQSPSTETALTVDVFNVISNFGGMEALARIDTFTVTAKDAHVDPTKFYYYDASADAFADDLTDFTDADTDDVKVPGHEAAEVGDYLLIGHTVPFNQLYIEMSTAMTDANTFTAEYYNGSAWVALDTNTGVDQLFETAAVQNLQWTLPSDWSNVIAIAQGAGGGADPTDNYYYIRLRCTAVATAGTEGLIKQGKISTIIQNDTVQRKITGLFHGTNRVVVTVNNATAVGAAKTIAGAGGFTGNIRLSAL